MNEQTQNQEPVVNLQDLATVVQVIDIASRRGAFEGRELRGVGSLRDKIEAFLQVTAQKNGQAPQGMMPPGAEAPANVPQDAPLADKVVE